MALTTRLPSPIAEPFYGFVETTGDALRLIEAARRGLIPRITRRLNDLERRAMIRSGSVFVFSNEESGIKRWTEGLTWSASRIVGNFLVYREVTDRVGSSYSPPAADRAGARRRVNPVHLSTAEQAQKKLEKSLVGCLGDGPGRFKADGLIKKTITVKIEGSDHHLIAYYKQEDVRLGRLLPPTSRNDIMALDIPPELLESTKFRVPPQTEPRLDGRPRYICDADEQDSSEQRSPASFVSEPTRDSPPYIIPSFDQLGHVPAGEISGNTITYPQSDTAHFTGPATATYEPQESYGYNSEPFDRHTQHWLARPPFSHTPSGRACKSAPSSIYGKPGESLDVMSSGTSLHNHPYASYSSPLPERFPSFPWSAGDDMDDYNAFCRSFETVRPRASWSMPNSTSFPAESFYAAGNSSEPFPTGPFNLTHDVPATNWRQSHRILSLPSTTEGIDLYSLHPLPFASQRMESPDGVISCTRYGG